MDAEDYIVVLVVQEDDKQPFVTFCENELELTDLLLNMKKGYKYVSSEPMRNVVLDYRNFLQGQNENIEFGEKNG